MLSAFGAPELLLIFTVSLLGGVVQGSIGYGMALVASPILLLLDPYFIPGPMTIAATVLIVMVLLRDGVALDFRSGKWALVGMIAGILIGTLVLDRFSTDDFGLIFAVLILLAVALSAGGFKIKRTIATLLGAGILSGIMGILTTTSGPPIAIIYQDAPGKQLRATISSIFILAAVFSMLSLASIDRFGPREFSLALTMLPGVILGFLISGRLARWVDRGFTRPAVLGVAALSALVIIVGRIM